MYENQNPLIKNGRINEAPLLFPAACIINGEHRVMLHRVMTEIRVSTTANPSSVWE